MSESILSKFDYEKHPDIYFPDGNIILAVNYSTPPPCLSANSAQYQTRDDKIILFRVYKGMLSKYSPVFSSMFALPDAPDNQIPQGVAAARKNEIFEGAPLVFMPDSKEEIEELLNVIFCRGSMNVETGFNPDFPIMTLPLMSSATKYEVDFITRAITDRFQLDWPLNIEDYGRDQNLFEPAAAMLFAERFKIPNVLPGIMYMLSCASHKKHWGDSSEDPDPDLNSWDPIIRVRWELLAAPHHLKLGELREAIDDKLKGVYRYIYSNDHRPGVVCSARKADSEKLQKLRRLASEIHLEKGNRGALSVLRELPTRTSDSLDTEPCQYCINRVEERRNRKMKELWTMLVIDYGIFP